MGWVAGLYEGEGNVTLTKTGGITVTVAMTDEDVVDRLDALFPGRRYVRKYDNGWKDCFVWVRNGKDAVEFLGAIRSLLGSRRGDSADEAIHYWNRPGNPREKKQLLFDSVANLSSQGLSGVEIARELNISPAYVSKIRKELVGR